ncbi:MAG: LCP family protein [Candidatus Shapirobacteria bacterium]|nr:LCP family protein [Candidatus Shapirobacteria bacterium]MDD5074141.1 LCP family protein [Candidatus Shapirobacteria bacterium]MDD5481803.1 LCP family protein [Candidatus Shapirobacteria bacterium]
MDQEIAKKNYSKYFLIAGIVGGVFTFLSFFVFLTYYYWQFSLSSGLGCQEIKNLYLAADLHSPREANLLILGLDQREADDGLLTDTLMAGFWRPKNNQATFISLPRDLWLDELKTKINALYYYGQKKDFDNKTNLLTLELEKILGLRVDYYLVLDFEALAQIVDLLSGVEIEVERAFDDYYFPSDDGANGLTHLRFEAGWQTMDGKRVLEYVRSRKSDDPEEGTDEARIKRQQKALLAMITKISNPKFLFTSPKAVGSLYRYWQENVDTNIPVPLLVNIGATYARQEMVLKFLSLPEEFLINPPIGKYGLWVWEPVDKSWGEIREWVENKISN